MAPWLHIEAPGTLGKPMECLVLGPCIPPPQHGGERQAFELALPLPLAFVVGLGVAGQCKVRSLKEGTTLSRWELQTISERSAGWQSSNMLFFHRGQARG